MDPANWEAIIRRLSLLVPEDIILIYSRAIDPCFPIIPISWLRSRLPLTWHDAPVDIALLCLFIFLFSTPPASSIADDDDPSAFESLYHFTKYSMPTTEGYGMNAFPIVQSRALVTLFEVAHGYYPAAYISLGATVRAADALNVFQKMKLVAQPVLWTKRQRKKRRFWPGVVSWFWTGESPSINRFRIVPSRNSRPLDTSLSNPARYLL